MLSLVVVLWWLPGLDFVLSRNHIDSSAREFMILGGIICIVADLGLTRLLRRMRFDADRKTTQIADKARLVEALTKANELSESRKGTGRLAATAIHLFESEPNPQERLRSIEKQN